MRRKILICFLFLFPFSLGSQTISHLELQLEHDIQDRVLDDFSHIEAAFIMSGITDPDSLENQLLWFDQLVRTIKDFHFDYFDRVGTAAKIFSYLHDTWLISYQQEATTLRDVIREKKYNCVAGTILYNLVCQELNIPTEAFETPTHTYTLFPNFTDRTILVENTRKSGFDILANLREQSKYLLQFYPENEAAQIGFDRLYAYENSKGRQIDNTELLGLLAYNRAYYSEKSKDYQRAYDFVLLAQKFNNDSRSNINFEIGLYYQWGNSLYAEKKYPAAFQVYKNACLRYWQNRDFADNCTAAFFSSIVHYHQTNKWTPAHQLLIEMNDLNILNAKDLQTLQQLLKQWLFELYRVNKKNSSREVIQDMENFDIADDAVLDIKRRLHEE